MWRAVVFLCHVLYVFLYLCGELDGPLFTTRWSRHLLEAIIPYPFESGGIPIPHGEKKYSVPVRWPFARHVRRRC
jgi:hypothetical protein